MSTVMEPGTLALTADEPLPSHPNFVIVSNEKKAGEGELPAAGQALATYTSKPAVVGRRQGQLIL